VLTDFQSTAIAMLDEEATVLDDAWLTSGTRSPGLVAALSGDVVLASGSGPDDALTVIDRLDTDVITRIRMPSGDIIGQLRAQTDRDYASNPQDVVITGPDRAWVTRFEPNLDPSEPAEGGTDLVGFDPTTLERNGERIDLSRFDSTVDGEVVPARPSQIAAVGDRLVVGLARLSLDFMTAAPGRIAVVDPEGDATSLELSPQLQNCGGVSPVPGARDRALVACLGLFADPRPGAGLLEIERTGDGFVVLHIWRPADDPDRPLAVRSATSLGAGRVVAVASGDFSEGTNDRLYDIDLTTGEAVPVTESAGAFELGASAYDPETGRLLVPDASEGIELWRRAADGLEREGIVLRDSSTGLPPRDVTLVR